MCYSWLIPSSLQGLRNMILNILEKFHVKPTDDLLWLRQCSKKCYEGFLLSSLFEKNNSTTQRQLYRI